MPFLQHAQWKAAWPSCQGKGNLHCVSSIKHQCVNNNENLAWGILPTKDRTNRNIIKNVSGSIDGDDVVILSYTVAAYNHGWKAFFQQVHYSWKVQEKTFFLDLFTGMWLLLLALTFWFFLSMILTSMCWINTHWLLDPSTPCLIQTTLWVSYIQILIHTHHYTEWFVTLKEMCNYRCKVNVWKWIFDLWFKVSLRPECNFKQAEDFSAVSKNTLSDAHVKVLAVQFQRIQTSAPLIICVGFSFLEYADYYLCQDRHCRGVFTRWVGLKPSMKLVEWEFALVQQPTVCQPLPVTG